MSSSDDPRPSESSAHASSKELVDEERKGLLSGVRVPEDELEPQDDAEGWWCRNWSRRRAMFSATVLALLILSAVFAPAMVQSSPRHLDAYLHPSAVHSNGTHDFKRTVLIVSIDGLRYVAIICMPAFDLQRDF